jgi:hypothetical protein
VLPAKHIQGRNVKRLTALHATGMPPCYASSRSKHTEEKEIVTTQPPYLPLRTKAPKELSARKKSGRVSS